MEHAILIWLRPGNREEGDRSSYVSALGRDVDVDEVQLAFDPATYEDCGGIDGQGCHGESPAALSGRAIFSGKGGVVAQAVRRARAQIKQSVWAGDVSAMRRLVKAVEALGDYVRNARLGALDVSRDARHDKYVRENDYRLDPEAAWVSHDTELRTEIIDGTELLMRAHQRRWSMRYYGTPEEVLEEIDPSQVERIEILFNAGTRSTLGGYDLKIDMDKTGTVALVESPEPEFVDLATKRLSDEFRLQRPWYARLRSGWLMFLIAIPGYVAALFLAYWFYRLGLPGFLAGVAAVLIGAAFQSLTYFIALKVIAIPLELFPDGGMAAGRRRLTIVGTVIAWVVGTILIPILLSTIPQLTPTAPSPTPAQSSSGLQ